MAKILGIETHNHFADYEEWPELAELQKPPVPDFKAAKRKTVKDYIVDGFWIAVALVAIYVASRVQS